MGTRHCIVLIAKGLLWFIAVGVCFLTHPKGTCVLSQMLAGQTNSVVSVTAGDFEHVLCSEGLLSTTMLLHLYWYNVNMSHSYAPAFAMYSLITYLNSTWTILGGYFGKEVTDLFVNGFWLLQCCCWWLVLKGVYFIVKCKCEESIGRDALSCQDPAIARRVCTVPWTRPFGISAQGLLNMLSWNMIQLELAILLSCSECV